MLPPHYIPGLHMHASKGEDESASSSKAPDYWRSVMDNVFIEFLGSLFIILSSVMYGGLKGASSDVVFSDPWTQLVPAVSIAAVMLCLKDGDCFFPDVTPTVTLLFWSVGAYDNWIQPFARISGQTLAAGIALWMCHDVGVPPYVGLGRLPAVVFAFEAMATIIEHMGVAYLFLPMLPWVGNRARAKHHHETEAPSMQDVMQAALGLGGLHWSLRLSFMSEMNPLVTMVKSALWNAGWDECVMGLWGQAVGVLVALLYVSNYYSPRKHRKKS